MKADEYKSESKITTQRFSQRQGGEQKGAVMSQMFQAKKINQRSPQININQYKSHEKLPN